MVQKVIGRSWVERWAKTFDNLKSVNPAVSGYFFESEKDKAAKGEESAPSFIFCAQDTVVL